MDKEYLKFNSNITNNNFHHIAYNKKQIHSTINNHNSEYNKKFENENREEIILNSKKNLENIENIKINNYEASQKEISEVNKISNTKEKVNDNSNLYTNSNINKIGGLFNSKITFDNKNNNEDKNIYENKNVFENQNDFENNNIIEIEKVNSTFKKNPNQNNNYNMSLKEKSYELNYIDPNEKTALIAPKYNEKINSVFYSKNNYNNKIEEFKIFLMIILFIVLFFIIIILIYAYFVSE